MHNAFENPPSPATPALVSLATRLSLFLLSTATLTFEIILTRLFSVAQFYHFAFMIVSIALLGFGASGSTLALFPALGRRDPRRSLALLALACSASMLGAYLLNNWLPFDSFSIAWDRKQVYILALHYVALAAPFFFSGMVVGLLLDVSPQSAGRTYAINLLGSALGCLLALLAQPWLGVEGTITLSSSLAALSAAISLIPTRIPRAKHLWAGLGAALVLLLLAGLDISLRLGQRPGLTGMELQLSPYKGLSYVLQYPEAQVIFRRWNAFSRVDVVRSTSIHSIPGLSYRYLQPLPQLDGLLVDGDELSPILYPQADPGVAAYLPAAIAYQLRPAAEALLLEPRGGLDIFTALALKANQVTVVESNPLIVEATGAIYNDLHLKVVLESGRAYIQRRLGQFDVVVLSLTSTYHPVRSGAYSLAEDYRYTVEAFQDALANLKPGGLFLVTRWLQDPPSEDLRLFALAVTALESNHASAEAQIVALRGYNTLTILVRNGAFTPNELQAIRAFAAERAFDLVYAPDIRPEETNLYNILPSSVYYQAFRDLLEAQPREAFYAAYPFNVRPPGDDLPFFNHFFKWSQARQVLAGLGKTWQPFGGAGYFVVVGLLVLALLLASALILLPLALHRTGSNGSKPSSLLPTLLYFTLIGFAYLLVEIPLFQHFMLYLGQPAYAITAVLFSLLLFSGLGSQNAHRMHLNLTLGLLTILLLVIPLALPVFIARTFGLPLAGRLVFSVLLLAPIGFLMGIPFPAGIHWLIAFSQQPGLASSEKGNAAPIPWAWAVNGASSVVASILAALLALSFGFGWVLRLGALCYAGAWLTIMATAWHPRFARQRQ